MPEAVRVWEILDGDDLKEIRRERLGLEERIENWLEKDISIISDELLVIGRQVETGFGGAIDILCLDSNGDVVILELKRDRTPREIVAQILDYASWVRDLSNEQITDIANGYLKEEGPLEGAFRNRFDVELPEILNERHKMLIIASEIDSSSERIIEYLSDEYGVGINAATFQYFRDDEREFLARTFLAEPSQVEYRTQTKTGSKRKPPLTYEELQELAERNDVGELYEQLVGGLTDCFDQRATTRSTIAFSGIIEESPRRIFSLVPGESDSAQGVHFRVYNDRLSRYLAASGEGVIALLPSDCEKYEPWKDAPSALAGFLKNSDEVEEFIAGLSELKQRNSSG